MAVIEMVNTNLAQGLGVIYGAIIEQSSTAADPALISALQTSARVPDGGALQTALK